MKKINEYLDYSIWDKLAVCKKPLFLYGTGNGGDKIITALESRGIKLDGVFASDGFVRDRVYHGYHIRSYSDTVREYGNEISVLLAFGTTLDSVIDFIDMLDKKHDLYIPDVPLYGGELFDMSYFASHREELDSTLSLLEDERSKSIFYDTVNFRLSGKLEYLRDTSDIHETLWEMFGNKRISTVIDGGAFKGDSASEFISALSPDVIYAIEADPKTFTKLEKFAEEERTRSDCTVVPLNYALWNDDCELIFSSSGSRGAGENGRNQRAKNTLINARTLDSLFNDTTNADFIKLDVEGSEHEAILSGQRLIRRCQPDMAVSLYHKTDDIISLISKIHSLLPSHKLYLRRVWCIPMWNLTLYAIK